MAERVFATKKQERITNPDVARVARQVDGCLREWSRGVGR